MTNSIKNEITRPQIIMNKIAHHLAGIWSPFEKLVLDKNGIDKLNDKDWRELFSYVRGELFRTLETGRLERQEYAHLSIFRMLVLWRYSKGTYRFDQDTYKMLLETSLGGDMPTGIFRTLPEWCIYIETPGLFVYDTYSIEVKNVKHMGTEYYIDGCEPPHVVYKTKELYGIFVSVVSNIIYSGNNSHKGKNLFILLDFKEDIGFDYIPLSDKSGLKDLVESGRKEMGKGVLKDILTHLSKINQGRTANEATKNVIASSVCALVDEHIERVIKQRHKVLAPLIAYLCIKEPELEDIVTPNTNSKRKDGERYISRKKIFSPSARTWLVGRYLGEIIRHRDKAGQEGKEQGEAHEVEEKQRKTPHYRRAFFTTRWHGKKDGSQDRRLEPVFILPTWVDARARQSIQDEKAGQNDKIDEYDAPRFLDQ